MPNPDPGQNQDEQDDDLDQLTVEAIVFAVRESRRQAAEGNDD